MTPWRRLRRAVRRGVRLLSDQGPRVLLARGREALGRRARGVGAWVAATSREPRPAAFLVVSARTDASALYRGRHHAEQLSLLGLMGEFRELAEAEPLFDSRRLRRFPFVILHRVPASPRLLEAVAAARSSGETTVLFDADDLVFDPGFAEIAPFFRDLSPDDQKRHREELRRCAETMRACDFGLATTEYLRDEMEKRGLRAFVVRNAVSAEMIAIADRAVAARPARPRERVRIGYFSGTRTHGRDFHVCAAGLLGCLERHPGTELLVVGYLDLDERFAPFRDRILWRPIVPWRELPGLIASVDVNLAPLEAGSPFNRGKSEVKYIEAALVGVPTVATPVPAFVHAIRHGENGLFAADESEWAEALERLCADGDLRTRLGAAARERTLEEYAPESRLAAWPAILARMRRPLQRARMAWLLEPAGTPVHAAARSLMTALEGRGHSIRACAPGKTPRRFADLVVATGPTTTRLAERARACRRRVRFAGDSVEPVSRDSSRATRARVQLPRAEDPGGWSGVARAFEEAALCGLGART